MKPEKRCLPKPQADEFEVVKSAHDERSCCELCQPGLFMSGSGYFVAGKLCKTNLQFDGAACEENWNRSKFMHARRRPTVRSWILCHTRISITAI
jgi:hypothetical protein